jgi:polygalacturonase
MHGHGLSIGSEIAGGVQNIRAERIHFEGTDNGIRVKANRDRGNDVSNLVFRDIDMIDVKNPVVISEYYPRILPPAGEVAPQPVTRLTPHFHNIVLENVTATGGEMAGAIVGLPEAPVDDIVLQNVTLNGKTGLSIGYANVVLEKVKVTADQGDAILKTAGANVTLK